METTSKLEVEFGYPTEVIVPDGMEEIVIKAIQAALKYEKFKKKTIVSVTFCDNEYIRELNREYRDKDKATDVLSFPQYEPFEAQKSKEKEILLGDIVISLERAEEQAKELGNTFLREVAFLAIHSTLHLLGYDHEISPLDEEIQCQKQKAIILSMTEFEKETI